MPIVKMPSAVSHQPELDNLILNSDSGLAVGHHSAFASKFKGDVIKRDKKSSAATVEACS